MSNLKAKHPAKTSAAVAGIEITLTAKEVTSQITYSWNGSSTIGFETKQTIYEDSDGNILASSVPVVVEVPVPPDVQVLLAR